MAWRISIASKQSTTSYPVDYNQVMILSQTMVDEAEIRVLDVKCHISAAKDQKNFQIDEVRVSESVRAEILGSAKTPRFGSGMSCVTTTIRESMSEFIPTIRSGSFADIR
ncbi:unnamed protein product [Arabidopsis thaliana]|uniref:(thale cress) hypothetical protein n=1 Tax=Arabidopsis thaliana TaxID=3702 RepID=A0A7G2E9Z6_ARATH|nr:unnamed protein product [Arabidopsis thaliana]